MDKTQKLIIARIEEMRRRDANAYGGLSEGFEKRDGRWTYLEVEGTHISEVDFSKLAPDQLVFIFEHICRRFYTQR